jgi:hypothetical protein
MTVSPPRPPAGAATGTSAQATTLVRTTGHRLKAELIAADCWTCPTRCATLRAKHPKPEVEKALKAAEDAGFTVITNRGHWGLLSAAASHQTTARRCRLTEALETPAHMRARLVASSLAVPTDPVSEPYTFIIRFSIPGATKPDEFAKRVYDDERLQDMALLGPDEYGTFDADFERESGSLPAAVVSALQDLISVLPEAEPIRVENDSLVTIAAIARRLGRSHESVRLYSRNKRGPGNFPAPVGKIDDKTAVWDWGDIAQWWEQAHGAPVEGTADTAFLTIINDALEMRRAAPRLAGAQDEELAAVAELLPSEVKQAVHAASARDAVPF